MRNRRPAATRLGLALLAAAAESGCASLCPILATSEDVTANVRPGDTVRIRTRAKRKLDLLVTSIEDQQIKGRRHGDPEPIFWVGFNAIETLEIECRADRNPG